MPSDAVKNNRLKISTFKLNSLLNITMAINQNLPVNELLARYEKILKEDLNIGKITILKYNDDWECILHSGFKENDKGYDNINVNRDLLHHRELTFVTSSKNAVLEAYDIIIPVINNNAPLAYILIGDIEEETEGVSPIIKHLKFIQTISNIIIVAIQNIRLFNESLRQEAIRKELELASRMQNMLIPDTETLPKNENIYFTAFYHPHLEVGGDYYDCIQLNDEEIGFCVADVSGKGISAALLMSNFQANIRALFTPDMRLNDLVGILNERISRNAKGEKFITLFIAKYNTFTKVLEFINAGHNPPFLYNVENGTVDQLDSGCVGMGMLEEIPIIHLGRVKMEERTKLLCYTDGLVELIDESGVEYGTEEIIQSICNTESIEKNIAEIIKKQKILEASNEIFDDITILGIEFF